MNNKTILLHEEYVSRINKVQDYIENNISEEFSLIRLSEIANFSPYHFHRIFYSITGETLFQYIQRVRIEKAAVLLLKNKKVSIMEIALECGFSNQASFAKAFKNYFNLNASKFRNEESIEKNINCKTESNLGKVLTKRVCYNNAEINKWCYKGQEDISYVVEVKKVTEIKVIYVRHTGPYKKDVQLFEKLFSKLSTWAAKRNLISSDETKWLILFHDTPDITEDNKLRISVCMTVSEEVKVDGEVGSLIIPEGKFAIGHFELKNDQYQAAWNAMFDDWFPVSGYQPDDGLSFELYPNVSPNNTKKQIVDIYIPVKPL